MLTNQDRRAILEQVKSSGSGDIIAALQGQPVLPQQEQMQEQQVQQEPASIPPSTPSPVNNVSMETPPVGQDSLVNSFSNTSPQIQDLPTGSAEPQLLKTGGVKSHGGLHTAEASSTAVAPVNIPTIIKAETDQERMIRLAAQKNTGTIYDPSIGNNPNKQWISGASNQMYASSKQKQKSQDYGETVLGFAAPIPLLNSMKVSASGAKIPGLIDDVVLGPIGKAYGKAKDLFKKNPLSTDLSKTKFPKYNDQSLIDNTSFEEMAKGPFNPNKLSKGDQLKISRAKTNHIKYLQSDEYVSKRMANTGESEKAVLAQVDDYIKEVNEAPINMEFFDNEISKMRMKGAFGQYYGAPSGKTGRIYVKRAYGTNLSDETMDVLKHELGHAGSPAGKMKVANPDAPIPNQYDKFVSKEAYKNYPTLKIKKEITGNYMRDPAEQQVRLVRTGEWLKQNAKWDGNPNNLTDGMIRRLIKSVSKSEVPHDVEMLIRLADATPKQMKDVIGKAWAVGPVAVSAGAASEKRLGGFDDPQEKLEIDYSNPPVKKKKLATTGKETSFRQSMMNFLQNTNKVDTNYVNNVMQVIAEHESKNVDDAIQLSGTKETGFYDGPARGPYQYEIGKEQSASTAMNRSATFTRDSLARAFNEFPTIYPEAKKESPDFSTLSREDQDGLFLGDKMNKNKTESKEFYNLVKNDGTPPTSDEVFEFWGKNHKRLFVYKIKTKEGEKTLKYTYDNLPSDKKALELKKWKARTKNKFKKGGIFTEENDPNLKVTNLVLKNTKKPKSKTELELKADTISTAFNNYTNPTLINNKNLNLQAAMGVNPNIGWNPNNKSFSKYGTPNLNLEGSFGLSGQYVKNNFSANAGVNFQTGNKPTYKAGIKYNFKLGGYKKKCKYGCW